MTTDADVFFKQYDEPTFKTVPIEELSEKLIERDEELELLNGPYSRLHTIKKGTKLKYPALEAMRAEHNADDMLFGRIPIIDDDGYVDTRSNYRVFMGYIDEDHNITDGPEYHKKERIELDRRKKNKGFNLYMSASYLKETYDIDLKENNDYINMQKYQDCIQNLNTLNMKDMFNFKNGAYLNCILSGDLSDSVSNHPISSAFDSYLPQLDLSAFPSQLNSTTAESAVLNVTATSSVHENLPFETSIDLSAIPTQLNSTADSSGMEATTTSLRESVNENLPLNLSTIPSQLNSTIADSSVLNVTTTSLSEISSQLDSTTADSSVKHVTATSEQVDEGFSSLIHSPCSNLSEMDAFERSMFNPIVEVFDCLSVLNMNPEEIREFTYTVGPEMSEECRRETEQIVQAPIRVRIYTNMTPMETTVNCLKLPKSFLMGKSTFKLPPEYGCAMVVSFSNLFCVKVIFRD